MIGVSTYAYLWRSSWQSDAETTVAAERDWTLHGLEYLRRKNDHQ